MIIVKVELHSAITGEVTEIGRAAICNAGTGTAKRGDYSVHVCRRGSTDWRNPIRLGEVNNYPRLSYNVWRLIIRALKCVYPEEA